MAVLPTWAGCGLPGPQETLTRAGATIKASVSLNLSRLPVLTHRDLQTQSLEGWQLGPSREGSRGTPCPPALAFILPRPARGAPSTPAG